MADVDLEDVRSRLAAVVSAMKASGAWEVVAPNEEAFGDMGAFGSRTMAFEQWLRFVFVPNVEKLIASDGPWPESSAVAVMAAREGDGNPAVAELVPALHAFDALFEDDDDDDDANDDEPAPESAAEPYERGRAAFANGDHAGALRAIDEAIARDPRHPNAHNFAGWVLLHWPSRTPEQLEAAIAHFREALDIAPSDRVPLANMCDALCAAGRADEAVALAERETASEAGERAAGAHNWLGWHWMSDPATVASAIDHLRSAVQRSPGLGAAHANLGRALEATGHSDEAYEQHAVALGCDDAFDRAFSHERRGAYEARHGWQRNALRSFRAALAEDRKRGGAREATYREAIDWLQREMDLRGIDWAPPDRDASDARWLRACELELPPGFGARDERGEPLADDVIEIERLVRAERWEDAVNALEAMRRVDPGKLVDAIRYASPGAELARRAGRRREALALQRLVVDAYAIYASWASSGGEGIARTADVDREREQLAAWEREG